MMRSKSGSKRFYLFVSLGAGVLLLALASLFLVLNHPVRAQDPPDPGIQDPRVFAMDPRPMSVAQLPIRVSVNYAADIIEEAYESGHTVWITVTNEAGATKATIELLTQPISYWATDEPGTELTGFSTLLGNWVPRQPDIVPGDFVHASSDEGFSTTMQVGDISANIDVTTDVVTGTVNAPWLITATDDDVQLKCKAYYAANPGNSRQEFDEPAGATLPDGQDIYSCDFGSGMWALTPGQLVAVSYDPLEPVERGNRSINVFEVPGPHLQIKKWAPGSPGILTAGEVVTPGNVVLNIEYRNIGTQAATGVVISDTMEGLTYLGDTHTVDPTGTGTAGDPLNWAIGTVAAGEHVKFQVFAAVGVGRASVSNIVAITSAEENGGLATERRDTWSAAVEGNGAWLTISKAAWTADPAPGETFVYVTNVCNTRARWPVDSTQATVTDTLPTGTTFVEWWSDDEGWEQDSQAGQTLVLTHPSIAADGCSAFYVRVMLGAAVAPDTQLCNLASVDALNNNTIDAYTETQFCHRVGSPWSNLMIDKMWAGGQLVPGGQLRYEVIVRNTGNVPIAGPVMITDTIPANATFVSAVAADDAPFTFDLTPVQTGNLLTWQFSDIDAGEWARFWLTFDLDDMTPVNANVTNTISVGSAGLDEDMSDNTASWSEMIRASGPNLRVRKTGDWGNYATNPHRINYRIVVENVGDVGVYEATVSDTYDARMRLAASPIHVDVWDDGDADVMYDSAASSFTARVDFLAPGESFGVDFDTWWTSGTGLYPAGTVAPGMVFTNTATVTPTDLDTDPGDNTAVVTNATGPELEVQKAYAGGLLQPGELVTFTLRVRNAQPVQNWWWAMQGNAVLTDTLPAGLTFQSAALWRCDTAMWCDFAPTVNGQMLTWNLGALRAGEWNVVRVVAEIGMDVANQTDLTNQAIVASTNTTVDLEADMADNAAEATITVVEPGTTYTLDIDTVGQGTVVAVPDKVAYDPGDVVTLTATPASGWLFAGWSGDITGMDREVTITMMSNVSATATFAEVALVLTKSVTPATDVAVGDVVTYTITIDNTGATALADLTLTDVLPAGITFVGFADATNVTPDPTYAAGTVSWSGDMPAGTEPARIIFTASVDADANPIITNIAAIQIGAEGIAVAQASFTLETSIILYLPLVMQAYMP